MNHIIKTIKSLEDSGVLIDGVPETVKHKIKKQEFRFLGALLAPSAASSVQPAFSSVVKGISRRRAGRLYMNKKISVPLHPLRNIEITNYFKYEPTFNGFFSRNNLPRILMIKIAKEHIEFHYLLTEI